MNYTALELVVAEIFADVLDVAAVEASDDFFELGGDSLQETRIIARLDDRFSLALPQDVLFEHSTVAALAREVMAAIEASPARAQAVDLLTQLNNVTATDLATVLAEI
jgi:acyl carrier protein